MFWIDGIEAKVRHQELIEAAEKRRLIRRMGSNRQSRSWFQSWQAYWRVRWWRRKRIQLKTLKRRASLVR